MNIAYLRTLNAGVCYWRMWNFAVAGFRTKTFNSQVLFYDKKDTSPAEWQMAIKKPEGKYSLLAEIQAWVDQADAVVMQIPVTREALAVFYALQDKYKNKPIIAECDDNILSTPNYNPAADGYSPGSPFREFAVEQFKAADGMIVSTPNLKEVYSDFCDDIAVIPNSIDFEKWDKLRRKNRDGIIIGWAGGASHEEDLKRIEKPIKRILRKNKNAHFVMCHGIPESFKKIKRVIPVQKFARIDKYPQHLASQGFDIFLAPLVDNAFNRGKSNLRWLEGSALKIPTIASNVGHFKETINDGVDGLLFDDEKEFEVKLQKLIDDRKYRRRIALAANARVRRDFNVDYVCKQYAEAVKGFIKKKQEKSSEQIGTSEPCPSLGR